MSTSMVETIFGGIVVIPVIEGFFAPIRGIVAAWRCRGEDEEK